MSIQQLIRERDNRYNEFIEAREDWIQSEAELTNAIDEQKLDERSSAARKYVFFICMSLSVAVAAAKWWS